VASGHELRKRLIKLNAERPDDCDLVPKIHAWVVGAQYPHTRQLWHEFFAYCPKEIIAAKNKGEKTVKLFSEEPQFMTYIEFKSADDPEQLVGVGLDFLLMTECGLIRRYTWEHALRPCLSSPGRLGQAILNSIPTSKADPLDPDKLHWFYDLFLRGQSPDWPDYKSWSLAGKPHPLMSAEEVEDARRSLPDHLFRKNYLGEFLDFGFGKPVYGSQFDPLLHVSSDSLHFTPSVPIHRCLDLYSYHHPGALWFQIVKDQVRVLKELMGEDVHTFEFAHSFTELEGAWFPEAVFQTHSDEAGDFKQSASELTDHEVLRKFYKIIVDSPPNVGLFERGRNIVSLLLRPRADGQPGIIIDPSCQRIIAALNGGYRYKEPKEGQVCKDEPLKDGINDTPADCLHIGLDMTVGRRAQIVMPEDEIDTGQRREREPWEVYEAHYGTTRR